MGLSTTYTKTETDFLIQQLEKKTASGYKGDLIKSDPAPTQIGFYMLLETGVYTNLGGIDAQSGKLNFASFDGTTWSKVEIEIPINHAKAPQWVAGTYEEGEMVYNNGIVWRAKQTTTQEPTPTATQWGRDLNFLKLRTTTPTSSFPYFTESTNTLIYSQGFIELYIDKSKYTSNDIRIRSFRVAQTRNEWVGERTEIVISDGTSDILTSTRYGIELTSREIISNSDNSVVVVVNWLNLTKGIGYGSPYSASSQYKVSSDVFNLNNSTIIKSYLNDIQLKNIDDMPSIENIKLNGHTLEKDGKTVNIPAATTTQAGLMSTADKAKLDNLINQGVINIEGSGVSKNASSFGFLPTNSASQNVTALQNAVNGGGTILIDLPGVYDVNDVIFLESNTSLIFGNNVFIKLQGHKKFLLNRGSITRTYDENISVKGLNIIANGKSPEYNYYGLRGFIAFFYIKNLIIEDFTLLDGTSGVYVIHICTFENIILEKLRIEGYKDAVHLGRGSKFIIRDCIFKTYDDPIALNAHDYTSGQPEYGWIEDGLIENCYDLADPDRGTVGYFARILAGAWVDWFSGMTVNSYGETCVNAGRLYKTIGTRGSVLTSTYAPTHESGIVTYPDGVKWVMMQENGVGYTAGCRNIHFRNIYLQKPRSIGFSIHFDNDSYSRSYYPNAPIPIQKNLQFENINMEAEIDYLINAVTPIDSIKIINSNLGNTSIRLDSLNTPGIQYDRTKILLSNNVFMGDKSNILVNSIGRNSDVKILGSLVLKNDFIATFSALVNVISNDL